ncbi:MAG: hypothetical protein KDA70_07325 [Planctomycetaceae bacterium]|nr:hypothetical protein [Planctomycetaceae bacterium]
MPDPIPEDPSQVRVLVVVEGAHDIEFLTRISTLLHTAHPTLPDLAAMECNRELVFLPIGGHPRAWLSRLAPLQLPEFYLLDGEASPEREQREELVAQINRRIRCRAVLTRKRSLENYLHPQAIQAVADITLEFGDHDCVATDVAQRVFDSSHEGYSWSQLTRRARVRLTNRVKHWLNTSAVEQMTLPLLQERDPDEEIISWLATIGQLAKTA